VNTHEVTEDYGTAKWVEREDAHARQVLSTAKVVVMFSLPVAGGFVAAAMQNNDTGRWSESAAVLMLLAALLTIRVMFKKRSELDPKKVEGQTHDVVQAALKAAAQADKSVAQSAHRLMVWQVLMALASTFAAAMALFK
jgi:hypothetical protein